MPKRVDHDARRRQIADALLRVAASRGLHAVGFREVAAEAGVSVRLVQYYFETKEQLFLFGLRRVGEQFGERVAAQLAPPLSQGASAGERAGRPAESARARIERVLLATMPLDEDSRPLYVTYTQYFALALTEPGLAAQPYTGDPDILATWLTDQLRGCQGAGLLPPTAVLTDEATVLLALTTGLGTALLAGTRSPAEARQALAHHLDRLLGPPVGVSVDGAPGRRGYR
ncbi:TetR/AcrR family transcriptional regulator [Pseudofrankia inefficax]|uniref:Regulatory protein TetR n=1 Tax=Pseudofrankia inefficax (strain DSM 45817 / CECT 9037 / DDB 130130 / EuI1c) TaxID=298654 RepID=E3J9V0_PSEI1|nr:TetR/AcrR family transcriptional regulator [Pseudofrankia inefficax]ADP78512.1 regulatory protein TetR [Pseudofrankia inefficax]